MGSDRVASFSPSADHGSISTALPEHLEHDMKAAPHTHLINARDVRMGDRIWDRSTGRGMTVKGVATCADGSIRIVTNIDDKRMTGSVPLRILN